jgi:hypothetical protein
MARCCHPIEGEFKPSYASVLVSPDLEREIRALESGPLLPCVTSWCAACKAPYLLTKALPMFKLPSEHHAHMLVLSRKSGKVW